jgi:hypothetical protein
MRRVVTEFQRSQGFPETGEVDQASYDALLIAVGLAQAAPTALEAATNNHAAAQAAQEAQAEALRLAREHADAQARELAAAEAALEANQKEIEAIEGENGSLASEREKLESLQAELVGIQAQLAAAESAQQQVSTIDTAQELFDQEQQELQSVEVQLASLTGQIWSLRIEWVEAQRLYQTELAQAQTLRDEIATLQSENTNLPDISTLESDLTAARDIETRIRRYINTFSNIFITKADILNISIAGKDFVWAQAAFESLANSYTGKTLTLEDVLTQTSSRGDIDQMFFEAAMALAKVQVRDAELAYNTALETQTQNNARVAELEAQLVVEEREANQALTDLWTVEGQITQILGQITPLEASLATAREEFAAARSTLATSLTGPETSASLADTTALTTRIAEIEGLTGTLTTTIAELDTQLGVLKWETAGLTTAVATERQEAGIASAVIPQLAEAVDTAGVKMALSEQELTVRNQEVTREMTAEEALAALELLKKEEGKGAIKAIQQALIDMGVDLGATGADGAIGPRTTAAIQAHPDVVLSTLAIYIDTTDNETVTERAQAERPRQADAIDTALETFKNGLGSQATYTADVATQIASEFTGEGIDADTRNKNAQYIALRLQELGLENNPEAQRLMERIMAEGKGHYENLETALAEALVDGSGRFATSLGRFPENFNGSYYRIRQALQGRRGELETGMSASQVPNGNADAVLDAIFGVHADYVATRMHVVTGRGTDGDADMSLELAGGIILSNAYYDEASGAVYAVVAPGNGCEGNLVVIPVEPFVPPAPRPVVPRVPVTPVTPIDPQTPIVPEEPNVTCTVDRECRDWYIYIRTRCYNSETWAHISATDWERTNETCGGGGWDDDGGATTTPWVEDGWAIDPGVDPGVVDDETPDTSVTETPGWSF